jgi:predicted adenylyl cyclase CyaB
MKNIEIETRSFVTKGEYKRLVKKFGKETKFLDSIKEETVYFKVARGDLRLRKNEKQAYIIFKEGKIHDAFRKELEIKCNKNDFKKIKELFEKFGFREQIRWFRERRIYQWGDAKLFLDNTKGYGFIIELEKIGNLKEKEKIHKELENKLKSLGIKITPKNIFDEKFEYYKKNWRKILKLEN